MIQPDEAVLKAFAHIAQNVPAARDFIAEWYAMELDRLPAATNN